MRISEVGVKIIRKVNEMRALRSQLTASLGFVPTMGALHQGHLSLIKTAKQQHDKVVVSIFVNPLQFNNKDDYQAYPDTLSADEQCLQKLGVDYLFYPSVDDIYPSTQGCVIHSKHRYMHILEGQYRPGHFDGVLTVVLKLLNIVLPHSAYFGEKDFQQYQLIKTMAEDLFLETKIVACPTVREASGLALSSRNLRLSPGEKAIAEQAATRIHQTTKQSIDAIKTSLMKLDLELEYLEIIDGRVFAAFYVAGVRLIDNFAIEEIKSC